MERMKFSWLPRKLHVLTEVLKFGKRIHIDRENPPFASISNIAFDYTSVLPLRFLTYTSHGRHSQ